MALDYESLLDRALDKLPDDIREQARFQVPDATILVEGNQTVFQNFGQICDVINRDPAQVLAYLLREMGTAGNLDGKRAIFKGKATETVINERLKGYIDTFVLCSECKRPDTRLVKESRTQVLECDACGAHRPLKVRKATKSKEIAAIISEGQTLEVMIQDVGRKGDGIAKKDKYVIYVPNTVKGAVVKIFIEKVSGTIAFAKKVI